MATQPTTRPLRDIFAILKTIITGFNPELAGRFLLLKNFRKSGSDHRTQFFLDVSGVDAGYEGYRYFQSS